MCSPIGSLTLTPYYWLRTNKHRTLNLIELSIDLLNSNSVAALGQKDIVFGNGDKGHIQTKGHFITIRAKST